MDDELETFDSKEVLEVPTSGDDQTGDASGMDTFDNPKSETPEEEEKKDTKLDDDSQVNLLDDQDDEDAKSKSDEKDKEEKKDEEGTDGDKGKEEEGKEEEKEESREEKPEVKKSKEIKGKLGEDEFGIPVEAEIKVRVKGKNEIVKVQDLINNYSGQKNWDQEYSKLGEEKKEFEAKNNQLTGEVDFLKGHIQKIVGILEDKDANPMDALEYLLDTTGRDTLQFKKRVIDTQLEQLEALQGMDEVERELYWKNQELEYLKRRSESSSAKSRQEQEEIQLRDKVDSLREAQGVSEDSFVEAHEELERLGYDNLTPEKVIDYATIRPHLEAAEGLIDQYTDSIDENEIDDVVSEIAVAMRSGDLSIEEAKAILEEEFGDTKELESLTKKTSKKVEVKKSPSKYKDRGEGRVESFDDFDEYYAS